MKNNPFVFNKLRDRFQAHLVRNLVILLVGLTVVGLGIPQALSLHDQSRAGKLLEDYIQREASDYQGQFACLIPFLADLPASDGEVMQAIDLLHRAVQLTPNQAHVAYLLGKANCLAQDYESAIKTFDGYISSRPDDPLGLMEQAFAYFSQAQTFNETQADEYARLMDLSRATLKVAGIGDWTLTQHADKNYENLDYDFAYILYALAGDISGINDSRQFRFMLLKIAYEDGQNNIADVINKYEFIPLNNEMTIFPESFLNILDGEKTLTSMINGEEYLVLPGNKNARGILLNVDQSNAYYLDISVLDQVPEPTEIELSLNLEPLMIITLKEGNKEIFHFSSTVNLKEGLNLISFRLINDEIVNGIDRNGYIGEINITRCD
jgi:tetratricopeptide (TPR) repeat protein